MTATTERLQAHLADRYRFTGAIGAGGMATVYLAEDLKHHRRVAVKVLRPELSALLGPERFLKEIEVTANLQHPHLLPLFDSGEADGLLYYVMPYVEGESLRQKLVRERQLGIDEALRITTQVAGALDYAHRQGVVHRDIKPENILLHEGQALIADFGIALAVRHAGGDRLTQTGLSLGTPQYMSPEQAVGDRILDARSDIYSLACVLYEMLAGEPPHTGPTVQAIVAKLLAEAPRSVTSLRSTVPLHVAAALDVALAKLPADRFESVGAFSRALEDEAFTHAGAAGTTAGRAQQAIAALPFAALGRWTLPIGAAIVVAAGYIGWSVKPSAPAQPALVTRFSLPLPTGVRFVGSYQNVAVSPDGARIAFKATDADGGTNVYWRDLASGVTKVVAMESESPFFSPDGRWLAFLDLKDGRLKTVDLASGTAQLLCDQCVSVEAFGTWADDGAVYFLRSSEIWKVARMGGVPQRVTTLDRRNGEEGHSGPKVVADGTVLLFNVSTGFGWDESRIEAQVLATGKRHVLVRGGSNGFLVAPGMLVYHRAEREELMAVPVDLRRMASTGPSVSLGVHVRSMGANAQYAVSKSGTLVYVAADTRGLERRVVLRDIANGATTPLPVPPRAYMDARLSPDGRFAALQVMDASTGIWLYDFAHSGLEPLTREGTSMFPVWSRDSKRIAYNGIRNGLSGVYVRAVDGTGKEEVLIPGAEKRSVVPMDWTPDGSHLVVQIMEDGGSDIWMLEVASRTLTRMLSDPAWECCGTLSPDGRWLAYTSRETGPFEVHLRSFPTPGRRVQLSRGGGLDARWSPDGRRLYYFSGTKVMSVNLGAGANPEPDAPRVVFEHGFSQANEREWDITADGKRLLLLERPEAERPATQVHLVLNWVEELKRRMK